MLKKKQNKTIIKYSKKTITNFIGRLTFATPKIIGIRMEVNSLVQTYDMDSLAATLIYPKQKKN